MSSTNFKKLYKTNKYHKISTLINYNKFKNTNTLKKNSKTSILSNNNFNKIIKNNKKSRTKINKILTKKLLTKLDIPTAPFKVFLGKDIKKDKTPLVVKYDADYLGDQTEIVFNTA